ncbi:MAG: oligosaccharide flippase family protein [Burkholderiales bacterium]|nr:oligosaccharide flippase family protein [Burkholderiales bacterium]
MGSPRRSVFVILLSSNAVAGIQFAASIALARILKPEDIGLFSVAAVLVAMAHVVRDLGSGSYLVREPDLTTDKIRAAFGLMLCSSWVIALVLLLASPFAASFYREPIVGNIMGVLALNMLLIPFGSLSLSVLRRNMQAGKQSIANLISTLTHVGVSIALALQGFGALSLAWASVAGTLASIAVAWWFRPPGLPWLPSLKGWRKPFNFGALVTAGAVIDELLRGIVDLILGRLATMRDVGLFSRALGATLLFWNIAGPATYYTALPYFSKVLRNGDPLKAPFLRAVQLFTGFAWAFFGALSGLAEYFVVGLYGSQWEPSVPVVVPICAGAFLASLFALSGQALLALGKARIPVATSALNVVLRTVFVLLLVPHGLVWVACTVLFEQVIMCFVHGWVLRKYLGIEPRELVKAVIPTALVAIPVTAVAWSMRWILPPTLNSLVGLAIGGAACAVVWLVALILVRHPVWDEGRRLLGSIGNR